MTGIGLSASAIISLIKYYGNGSWGRILKVGAKVISPS